MGGGGISYVRGRTWRKLATFVGSSEPGEGAFAVVAEAQGLTSTARACAWHSAGVTAQHAATANATSTARFHTGPAAALRRLLQLPDRRRSRPRCHRLIGRVAFGSGTALPRPLARSSAAMLLSLPSCVCKVRAIVRQQMQLSRHLVMLQHCGAVHACGAHHAGAITEGLGMHSSRRALLRGP